MMKTLAPLFLSCFFLLGLAACGPSTFPTEVTRFHKPFPFGDGKTSFTILPDESQIGSLEFETYAQLVAQQMTAQGYRPVPASVRSDLVVRFRYGTRETQTTVAESPPSSFIGIDQGGWGSYGSRRGLGWGYGMSIPLSPSRPVIVTQSTHFIDLDIQSGADVRSGEARRLFEGHASADGTTRPLSSTIPLMIQALFDGFPGKNGTTIIVSVPLPPS